MRCADRHQVMQYAAELLSSCADVDASAPLVSEQLPSACEPVTKNETASADSAGATRQRGPDGGNLAEEKRVCNRTLREQLGVTLRFPTYREGLHAIHEGDQTPFD